MCSTQECVSVWTVGPVVVSHHMCSSGWGDEGVAGARVGGWGSLGEQQVLGSSWAFVSGGRCPCVVEYVWKSGQSTAVAPLLLPSRSSGWTKVIRPGDRCHTSEPSQWPLWIYIFKHLMGILWQLFKSLNSRNLYVKAFGIRMWFFFLFCFFQASYLLFAARITVSSSHREGTSI